LTIKSAVYPFPKASSEAYSKNGYCNVHMNLPLVPQKIRGSAGMLFSESFNRRAFSKRSNVTSSPPKKCRLNNKATSTGLERSYEGWKLKAKCSDPLQN